MDNQNSGDELLNGKCVPCEGGVAPLAEMAVREKLKDLKLSWELVFNPPKISHVFSFSDFKSALAFVNKIGELAEREGHHPDISLSYGSVRVDLTTHAINGLSLNDFILARKIEEIFSPSGQ